MDAGEAVGLLTGGVEGIAEWNRRRSDGEPIPPLHFANLRFADLRSAHLRYLDLSLIDLQGAVLAGVDLRACRLHGTALCRADLRKADLRGIIADGITRADQFPNDIASSQDLGADFAGADLRGTDLSRARLRGNNLESADLRGASLRGADLRAPSSTGPFWRVQICGTPGSSEPSSMRPPGQRRMAAPESAPVSSNSSLRASAGLEHHRWCLMSAGTGRSLPSVSNGSSRRSPASGKSIRCGTGTSMPPFSRLLAPDEKAHLAT